MTNTQLSAPASKRLRIALWIAQVLLALVYIPAGLTKLFSPVAEVATQIPWAADVAVPFLRFIGAVDLSAGLGIILPALTRLAPRLTIGAAIGSVVLQIAALIFHSSRGEFFVVPFNLVLIALSAFVAWGRIKKAPIAGRGEAPESLA